MRPLVSILRQESAGFFLLATAKGGKFEVTSKHLTAAASATRLLDNPILLKDFEAPSICGISLKQYHDYMAFGMVGRLSSLLHVLIDKEIMLTRLLNALRKQLILLQGRGQSQSEDDKEVSVSTALRIIDETLPFLKADNSGMCYSFRRSITGDLQIAARISSVLREIWLVVKFFIHVPSVQAVKGKNTKSV